MYTQKQTPLLKYRINLFLSHKTMEVVMNNINGDDVQSISIVDLLRMSAEEGIPVEDIRYALGVPIVAQEVATASTIEEVRKAYDRTLSGSETRKEAIIKLSSFYKK